MTAKRALIVDDSKSARVVLSRMLEKYGIETDAVESAEAAIDHLNQNRPDVIFMDHMMPGMDGFQAVQAIKNNPLTATIPIMMYTSQQGELYVGQARALGAVGVLPKLVKPVDVSKVLYQLRLLPDRRDSGPSVFVPANEAAEESEKQAAAPATPSAVGLVPEDWHPQLESALRNHDAELRRFVVATLDTQADRVVGDVRNIVNEIPALQTPPEPPRPQPPYLLIAALAAVLVAGSVLGLNYMHIAETNRALTAEKATLEQTRVQLERVIEELVQREAPRSAAGPASAVTKPDSNGSGAAPVDLSEPVPYGEIPLSLGRVDALRELLGKLESQGFHGDVKIRAYMSEFCLDGSVAEGYALAPPEVAVTKCTLVGNPFDDSGNTAQRQSVAFANLVSSVRQRTNGNIRIEVLRAERVSVPASGITTAGQWNEMAARLNRVELTAIPVAAEPPSSTPAPE